MFNMKHQGKEMAANDSEDSDVQEPLDGVDPPDEDEESPYRDPPEGCVRLRPSQFLGIPSTVFVEYPPELGIRRNDNSTVEPLGSRKMGYKSYWERICIKNAHIRAGFAKSEKYWTSLWSKHQNSDQMKELNCLQKINHFPASWCIGRKDRLTRTLNTMKRVHGSNGNVFDFHPETFILPGERDALHRLMKSEISAAITTSSNGKTHKTFNSSSTTMSVAGGMWIVKPCAASCGQGIKVMTGQQALELPRKKKVIVQRYLARPYLIDGRKFDLRIYVLVSGVDPLRVYIHDEGLTRISTAKYSVKNLGNSYAHLTNYSINKNAPNFKAAEFKDAAAAGSEEGSDYQEEDDTAGEQADSEMEGFKWSLAAFRRWLAKREGREVMERTFDRIFDLCLKTMIAAESEITPQLHSSAQYRSNCFELFGCDVILDSALCPHLLEVNVSPSLMGSSPLDKKIKGILIADVLHIVGMYPHDPALLRKYDAAAGAGRAGEGVLRRGKDTLPANPFAFSSLSKLMSAQDRYRRDPGPESIDIAALGETEASWLLLLMAEDELQRARSSKFHCVHPSASNAAYYTSLYRSGRFSDHLLAHWVSSGGSGGRYGRLIPSKFRPRDYKEPQTAAAVAAGSPAKSPSSTGPSRQPASLSGSGTDRPRAKSAGRAWAGTTRLSTYIPAAMLPQPACSASTAKVRPLQEVVGVGAGDAAGARSASLSPRGGTTAATSSRKPAGDTVGEGRRAREQTASEADHLGRRPSRGRSEPRRKGSQSKVHEGDGAPSAPVVPSGFLGSPVARPRSATAATPVSGLRSRLECGISHAAEIYGPSSPPSHASPARGNHLPHMSAGKQQMPLGAGFGAGNAAAAVTASKSQQGATVQMAVAAALEAAAAVANLGSTKGKVATGGGVAVPRTLSRPSSAQRRGAADSSKGSSGLYVAGGGPAPSMVQSISNGSNLSAYTTGNSSSTIAVGSNASQSRPADRISPTLLQRGGSRGKPAQSAAVGATSSSPLKLRRTVDKEAGEQLFAQVQRTLHIQPQSTPTITAAGSGGVAMKISKV